jgi:hypothetical protein
MKRLSVMELVTVENVYPIDIDWLMEVVYGEEFVEFSNRSSAHGVASLSKRQDSV